MLTSNVEVAQGGGKNVSAKTVLSYARARVLAAAGPRLPVADRGARGLLRPDDVVREHLRGGAPVGESGRRLAEEGHRGGARREGEDEGSAAEGDERDGAERQRRHGLGVERELPARAARLPDPDAAERHSRQRTDASRTSARRSTSIRGRRGRRRPRRKVANLFGSADVQKTTPAIRALANDAMLTAVVGQTFHGTLAVGPGRPDAEARAGERRARRLGVARSPPRAPVEGRLPADGADRARAVVVDRSRAAGAAVPVRRQGQAQDGAAHLQDGLERLLGRAAVELGGRTGAREPQLRAQHRRPALRAVLQRPAPPHGRSQAGRRQLLGRQHPARPALERDDARDRQGAAADRQGSSARGRRRDPRRARPVPSDRRERLSFTRRGLRRRLRRPRHRCLLRRARPLGRRPRRPSRADRGPPARRGADLRARARTSSIARNAERLSFTPTSPRRSTAPSSSTSRSARRRRTRATPISPPSGP